MFRPAAVLGIAAVLCAHPAAAQTPKPRFYIASSTGSERGTRGPTSGASVPTAGGLFGVQLTERVSLELEVDRGFHETARTAESLWISLARPGASRDEIERLGIHTRFDRTQWVGRGLSGHILWRTRESRRVNVGMLAGVSSRRYSSRVVRTPVSFGPGVSLPAGHSYFNVDDSVRRLDGTGLTVGGVIFVRLTDGLAVAPDVRFTRGMISDSDYILFRAGTRIVWSF